MAANQATVSALASEAAAQGARMLFLPECVNYMKGDDDVVETNTVLQPLSGPSMTEYRAIARRNGLWISVGGFQELSNQAGKGHNTHVVIDADGRLAAVYRKAHLFDLDLPGLRLQESERTVAGKSLTVVDTPAGRLGLSVCYDLRFPRLYGALTAAGSQLLAIPAAFTVPTGAAHWELLLRARAVETQCYVVAAAQVGVHNKVRTSYGHAMIIDPWGVVLAQAGGTEAANAAPSIVTAHIDLDYVDHVRSRMPVGAHAVPALYEQPVAIGRESLLAGNADHNVDDSIAPSLTIPP